jgi:hypothetical protein
MSFICPTIEATVANAVKAAKTEDYLRFMWTGQIGYLLIFLAIVEKGN